MANETGEKASHPLDQFWADPRNKKLGSMVGGLNHLQTIEQALANPKGVDPEILKRLPELRKQVLAKLEEIKKMPDIK